jgi:hypothetical protein
VLQLLTDNFGQLDETNQAMCVVFAIIALLDAVQCAARRVARGSWDKRQAHISNRLQLFAHASFWLSCALAVLGYLAFGLDDGGLLAVPGLMAMIYFTGFHNGGSAYAWWNRDRSANHDKLK